MASRSKHLALHRSWRVRDQAEDVRFFGVRSMFVARAMPKHYINRVYRVVGIYDQLEKDGRIIREERDGFRLLVGLTKGDQASAIAAVENVLARLKG
jgi:hypothetical protein